jgi:hypothetical protein
MNKSLKFLIVILLLSIPVLSFSQVLNNAGKQKDRVLKTIDSIFVSSFNQSLLKDSVAFYAINFTVKVAKDKKGRARVSEVKANDSLAYELFPAYKRLHSIDYNSLLGAKQKITLLIPVLISNTSPEQRIYKKPDGSPLIDMAAALNAIYALTSDMPYNNKLDGEVALNHRIFKHYKTHPKSEDRLKDVMLLNPYVLEILNIPKTGNK